MHILSRFNDTYYKEAFPASKVTKKDNVVFRFPEYVNQNFYFLGEIMIFVSLKLMKPDLSPPNDSKKVAPVNCILNSLFDQVTVSLNDTVLNNKTKLHPWKNYLSTMLSNGNPVKYNSKMAEGKKIIVISLR